MKAIPVATPPRLALLVLAAALGGCSTVGDFLQGDKVDYRSGAVKSKPLDVPPDLTQLSRDTRLPAAGSSVSAAALGSAPAARATGAGAPAVALDAKGEIRVERDGDQRWLVVPAAPEVVWPQVRAYWIERGFTLASENPEAGTMETDWAENRAKLPNDLIRSTLGRFIDRLYDTGYRDSFRTRIERGPGGTSEIYVTHRGLEEAYTDEKKESTAWRARPRDPALEADFLTRLMVKLGTKEDAARTAVAQAPERPPRARLVAGQPAATLEVDDGFDRTWRRVGLALDRTGFTVEDRDRAGGLFFVRTVDATRAAEEPGFFSRLFGAGQAPATPVRYRVQVSGTGEKSRVAVLTATGAPEAGPAGQRIVELLLAELK